MKELLLVGFGGLFGSVSRYGVYLLTAKYNVTQLFLSTLTVNLIGCFLIGLLSGLLSRMNNQVTLFMVAGFCGGFTTFSSFALDGIRLLREGLWLIFSIYASASMAGGMILCVLGIFLTTKL